MENLRFGDKQIYMEGIIIEIQDGAVSIDLKGRLGFMKIPRRMLISNHNIKVGQEVGFMMSYPESLSEEINEKYLDLINHNKKMREERSNESFNS
ncbi:CBO2463/CBO2479 domain-containing protein [Alkaliphilus oremlandii]|uniref:Uncharacterized protein n=1 Tax=Alkaliphilus oremlandii (strain OhILAs) TaxID=350688 RepID=A8MEC8_ALKOO|nr:CBO2463/CBO2479 domain-containing protein [Alkaliphilus oremlandii]ABW17599.1 conserved hypothetical protein [Alkaliphilus oremlandii OhILAs]